MTKALQAAVDLAGITSFCIKCAVQYVAPALTLLRQSQVFHGHKLSDREAVMHLSHADLFARIGDSGLGVGLLRSHASRMYVASIPVVGMHFPAIGNGQLQCLKCDE